MAKKFFLPLLLVAVLVCLQGCAIYSTATDERLVDTMSSDKAIATLIKKNLMAEKMAEGWEISVYCYYGHVFLVGECPRSLRAKAIEIAKQDKRVRSVTPHWFAKKESPDSDIVLATKLRTALIGTSNLNSTRIDTEVNANRVVLLGVANSSEERKIAVRAARGVEGVATVTSYIMLPVRPGQNPAPTGITYGGFHPPKHAAKTGAASAGTATPADLPATNPGQDLPYEAPAHSDAPYGGIGEAI